MGRFNIVMKYSAEVTNVMRELTEAAKSRWEEVIISDFHDFEYDGKLYEGLEIAARVVPLKGGEGGKLAHGVGTVVNPYNLLPIIGYLEVDEADLSKLLNDTEYFYHVILHEIGHVIGLDLATWKWKNLIEEQDDRKFLIGEAAQREYGALLNIPNRAVPLETEGGADTVGQHIRELEFGSELMTGFISAGINQLSRVTLGILEDMGFEVDYNAADDYTFEELDRKSRTLSHHGHICGRPNTEPIIPKIPIS